MKNFIAIVVCGVILPLIMAFAGIRKTHQNQIVKLKPYPIANPIPSPKIKVEKLNFKGHEAFLMAIGQKESSNRYEIVNKFGYMGKYQFGNKTLKSIGINVSRKTFLTSPSLQEEAMDRLLTQNYKSLRRYINKYEGKYIHGVLITKSGVLAAAHLGGAGNVRKFFKKGYEFEDANGTKITSYMRLFSGYSLNI